MDVPRRNRWAANHPQSLAASAVSKFNQPDTISEAVRTDLFGHIVKVVNELRQGAD